MQATRMGFFQAFRRLKHRVRNPVQSPLIHKTDIAVQPELP